MAEVFAGFVAGYIVTLISTPLLAIGLFRLRAGSALLAQLLPAQSSVVGISVLLHGAMLMLWTALGIILGLVLYAMRDAGGAAGSLNGPYTLFVAALLLMVFAPLVVFLRPLRRVLSGFALAVVAVFGWLMPYMAEWTNW